MGLAESTEASRLLEAAGSGFRGAAGNRAGNETHETGVRGKDRDGAGNRRAAAIVEVAHHDRQRGDGHAEDDSRDQC